jgi:hypothetical protein
MLRFPTLLRLLPCQLCHRLRDFNAPLQQEGGIRLMAKSSVTRLTPDWRDPCPLNTPRHQYCRMSRIGQPRTIPTTSMTFSDFGAEILVVTMTASKTGTNPNPKMTMTMTTAMGRPMAMMMTMTRMTRSFSLGTGRGIGVMVWVCTGNAFLGFGFMTERSISLSTTGLALGELGVNSLLAEVRKHG